jgi:hypothetical protein
VTSDEPPTGPDDTQPVDVPAGVQRPDLRLVDFGPHAYGLGTIESVEPVDEEGDDRG